MFYQGNSQIKDGDLFIYTLIDLEPWFLLLLRWGEYLFTTGFCPGLIYRAGVLNKRFYDDLIIYFNFVDNLMHRLYSWLNRLPMKIASVKELDKKRFQIVFPSRTFL